LRQRIVQVDAFASAPYTGNPAAVCVLERPRAELWMRAVAREMNLSETAFLHPERDGWRLRWFTPTVEVDLCGHATLASAHVLWEEDYLTSAAAARFYTRSGLLTARRIGEWIELDFPAEPPARVDAPDGLLAALSLDPVWVGRNRFDYLVELSSAAAVRELRPNIPALGQLAARGVIVTARGTGRHDFVSRFFAPAAGVDEDPVTGSAHCALGPYWAERLDRNQLTGYQVSTRGGEVRVTVDGDRVHLGGRAVTVLRGELLA
jgi:predicted PhzF superfamily epimerase YddE/YHI9